MVNATGLVPRSRRNNSKVLFYPESRFGGFTDCDAQIVFWTRVNALLTPDAVVLDVGCGRGRCAHPWTRNPSIWP